MGEISQEANTGFAFESLEAVRKKLLDLSGRNTLLNYKHQKASCLRLVDELPDQIMQVFQAGKSFTFIPVPEPTESELIEAGYIEVDSHTQEKKTQGYPTAEQWAKHLGFSTTYDLPAKTVAQNGENKHQDTKLQTLLYPPELEARLRSIRSKAETAIENSGTNILYLALGFLEWYESRESDTTRLAPLFTLPVRLERAKLDRDKGVYRYTITLKDDGLLTNITLREKLANDFDLALPAIGEDTSPEVYFEQIQETILRHKPRWKIRRQASVVLLNFSKQAMYQDLDPANWPSNARIENHPIIQKFFSSYDQDSETGTLSYAPEHPIDDIDQVHDQFPLIFDADSSQHSALIDAVKGENLVIEGPPGSGKSQTITNLIAACITNGKKVLFVAEKMAALNVVKRRLDQAGLGDFCLELHSHKTHKQKISQDLNQRLNKQSKYPAPSSIETDIAQFEGLKGKLHDYVELINSQWQETGLTLHDILNKATRYREELSINPDHLSISGISGQNLTELKRTELFDQAYMLGNIYDQASKQAPDGEIANHYWYGVNNTKVMGYQVESFNRHLEEWTEHLKALSFFWQQQVTALALGVEANAPLDTLQEVSDALAQLPEPKGGELFEQLPDIIQQKDAFVTLLTDYEHIHQQLDSLKNIFKPATLNNAGTPDTIKTALDDITQLEVPKSCSLETLALDCEALKRTEATTQAIHTQFQQIIPSLPTSLQPAFIVSENGLKEFTTLVNLIEQLPLDLWRYRDTIFDNPDLDGLLEQLTGQLRTLTPLHKELLDQFSLHRLPAVSELKQHQATINNGGFFRHFSPDWWKAKKAVLSLSATPKPDKKSLISLLPSLIEYADGVLNIDKLNQENQALDDLYLGVETPMDRIVALRKWYQAVRQEYGIGFGDRVAIGNAMLMLDRNLAMAISEAAKQNLHSQAGDLMQAVTGYQKRFKGFKPLTNPQTDLAASISPLAQLRDALEASLNTLADCTLDAHHNVDELTDAATALEDTQKQIAHWQQAELTQWLIPEHLALSTIAGDFSPQTLAACNRTLAIVRIVAPVPALLNSISTESNDLRYQALRACSPQLKVLIETASQSASLFIEQGEVNASEWTESSKNAINSLIARNQSALDNPDWLNTWLDYIRIKNKLSAQGLSNIINSLEANSINTKDLEDVVKLVVYHQLATEVLPEDGTLALFSGMEQMAIRQKFKEYDIKILELQRQKIAFKASSTQPPAGVATGKVSNYTETALVKHEAGKKTRHIAVRNLLKRAGKAIQALNPCFMMSPMSVAQYLEPGQFTFDIVVMDEASQIRPEDALGAVARGTSVVVVGDSKQLPPTAFFQKAVNNDDDADAVALEESESILASVIPMFKNRRLRWHYRSRHESLVAFSNQHFYDSNLILFPSPFQESEEFGIRLHRVTQGRFVNRRNVEEAREVAKAAEIQLVDHSDESVGIVAMNSEQREEIEKQLEQLIKDNPKLQAAYENNQNTNEPIFIKNLENVQGDERDVIIISMTYGPEQVAGRTMQRFGPINSDVGWRRLNVLFTRSKKRMHIFSTMGSSDVLVSETSKKGVQSLRAFLEYCETGHLHHAKHTGKAPDSDFEIAVMRALAEHGYDECEPQLGVAGYFLDLAVKDPGQPGRFLMGIECDGATYHSAKSTRDRDRLRQDILESLGWKIRRIWSTDWFKNPQAQLQPILQELEKLRSPVTERAADIEGAEQADQEIDTTSTVIDLVNDGSRDTSKVQQPMNIDELSLKERLQHFNKTVIQKEVPGTSEEKQLLRPAMIEAVLNHLPCSKAEFLECIPSYLRTGISTEEGRYLDQVLKLVADYG